MNFVWAGEPTTSSDVIAVLETRCQWKPRTIRTLLSRLVDKQALEVIPDGKRNLYQSLVSRDACIRSESHSFLQRVFGGDAAPMVINLVKEAKLSPEEIEELRNILNNKEQP